MQAMQLHSLKAFASSGGDQRQLFGQYTENAYLVYVLVLGS